MACESYDLEGDLLSEEEESIQSLSDDDSIPFAHEATSPGTGFDMSELLQEVIVAQGDKIHYSPDNNHVELNFGTSLLTEPVKQALGLADVEQIVIELIFTSRNFGAGTVPRVTFRCTSHKPPAVVPVPEPAPQPAQLHDQEMIDAEEADGGKSDGSASSESNDDTAQAAKRQAGYTAAYQLASIASKGMAPVWPETANATWRQSKQWFVDLHAFLSTRLTKLGDYCVVCGEQQPLSGIKPVACSKSLCSHQFDEMGFGASMDLIYSAPSVADLLISMAAAAADNPNRKHRQRFFACPNPPSDFVLDPLQHNSKAHPDDTMRIDWTTLQEVLYSLPPVSEMAAAKDLKRFLTKYHANAYRLVRWILSTCRGHIVELKDADCISGLGGRQFKLFTNTFNREIAFQKLKRQHGSRFLFHGSPFGKWHSILRTCLQNFSNTEFMTAGASYGAGVYAATHASTSLGYSRSAALGSASNGYRASVFGSAASCLALVEVADGEVPTTKYGGAGGVIHVVKNHDAIVARYFFVYSSESEHPSNATSADQLQIPQWGTPR